MFFGIRGLLPAFAGSNIFLRPLASAIQPVAWVFTLPFLITAAFAALRASRRRDLLDSQSGLQSLRALSWQDFERLVGEAYRRRGYTVEEAGGTSPDGGVDVLLYSGGRKTVVQCKRWRTALRHTRAAGAPARSRQGSLGEIKAGFQNLPQANRKSTRSYDLIRGRERTLGTHARPGHTVGNGRRQHHPPTDGRCNAR